MRVNIQKTVIIITTLLSLTLLVAVKAVEASAALPLFTLIVGYAVGNGVGARSSEGRSTPLIERKTNENE